MESTRDWYEPIEDDSETLPKDGRKILAEFENGTQAQCIYQHRGPLTFIGLRPEGVGNRVSLKRWRYLDIP